jgi:hypothetical protein
VKGPWSFGSVNTSVVQALLKNFDALHRFLQRLDCLHVEHRIVDALGDGAKVVTVFVAVRGFADEARGDQFNFLGDETDLGVGLTFFEVVLADLESLNVGPLGVGVNDVLLQLDVGYSAVAVVGVDNVAVCVDGKRKCPIGRTRGRVPTAIKIIAESCSSTASSIDYVILIRSVGELAPSAVVENSNLVGQSDVELQAPSTTAFILAPNPESLDIKSSTPRS